MNKKGQYQMQESYSGLSPVLIIGIVIFMIPFILPIMGIKGIPDIILNGCYGLGILTILIGGAMSIFNKSN